MDIFVRVTHETHDSHSARSCTEVTSVFFSFARRRRREKEFLRYTRTCREGRAFIQRQRGREHIGIPRGYDFSAYNIAQVSAPPPAVSGRRDETSTVMVTAIFHPDYVRLCQENREYDSSFLFRDFFSAQFFSIFSKEFNFYVRI